MFFRGILGFVSGLIVVGLLVGLGSGVYQAGIAQGIVDAGRFRQARRPGRGLRLARLPGIFGLLFGLFFLFILFGIIRAAFSAAAGWAGAITATARAGARYGSGDGPEAWRGDRGAAGSPNGTGGSTRTRARAGRTGRSAGERHGRAAPAPADRAATSGAGGTQAAEPRTLPPPL